MIVMFSKYCSFYLLGAWLPPNFAQTITVSEGLMFPPIVAAPKVISTS